MAEDLDNLLNLFFSSDCRRDLVGADEPVERHTEMFQIGWKLKLFAIEFFFLFAFLYLCSNVFLHSFGVRSHRSQNFNK